MLKKILIGLAALVAVFLIVVALQPANYTVTRSQVIAAPPAVPFALVSDFKSWPLWSPWENVDPNMVRTFSGPEAAPGSKYSWLGNDQVGEGSMTITEVIPPELVKFDLNFVKPMPGLCPTTFQFTPEGAGTKVTWTMSGTKNFIAKGFCMFMDMDKMCGGMFEQGLAKMKSISESGAAAALAPAATAQATVPTLNP